MRVLVTGTTGFVGSRVVSELSSAGIEVIAVGGPRSPANSVDITDPLSVEKLKEIGHIDAVVHTAALAHRFAKVSDEHYHQANVIGVENVAKLAVSLRAKHFVLFSSTLVYGRRDSDMPVTEDFDCRPIDAYGRSKLEGEFAAKDICEKSSIDLSILRPSPIIGEGSKGNFRRLIAAIDRRRFVMVGNGENLKSLIYVGDVATAVVKVIANGGRGTQVYNLAGGEVRMIDIVSNIHEFLGRKPLPVSIPAMPTKLFANLISKRLSLTLNTWLADDVYSTEKLRKVCGFDAEIALRDAIKLETDFYLKHK